jgi:DNA-binding transcriptional regulator YiaG
VGEREERVSGFSCLVSQCLTRFPHLSSSASMQSQTANFLLPDGRTCHRSVRRDVRLVTLTPRSRKARRGAEMSQIRLAERIGVNPTTVMRWEELVWGQACGVQGQQ